MESGKDESSTPSQKLSPDRCVVEFMQNGSWLMLWNESTVQNWQAWSWRPFVLFVPLPVKSPGQRRGPGLSSQRDLMEPEPPLPSLAMEASTAGRPQVDQGA